MFDGLIYAAFYGFLLAFAVGPVFFTLIETAITKGFKAAIYLDLGALAADIVFILIAFFSTNRILDKIENDPGLMIFGGVILMAYGAISYVRTHRTRHQFAHDHHSSVGMKKNLGGLFFKGFLLNFVNFGVLAAWIGTIIMATALTSSDQGVFMFITIVLISFFLTDLLKIFLAKNLSEKMTPRFIFKAKKWICVMILGIGMLFFLQGVFPKRMEARINKISGNLYQKDPPTRLIRDFH